VSELPKGGVRIGSAGEVDVLAGDLESAGGQLKSEGLPLMEREPT